MGIAIFLLMIITAVCVSLASNHQCSVTEEKTKPNCSGMRIVHVGEKSYTVYVNSTLYNFTTLYQLELDDCNCTCDCECNKVKNNIQIQEGYQPSFLSHGCYRLKIEPTNETGCCMIHGSGDSGTSQQTTTVEASPISPTTARPQPPHTNLVTFLTLFIFVIACILVIVAVKLILLFRSQWQPPPPTKPVAGPLTLSTIKQEHYFLIGVKTGQTFLNCLHDILKNVVNGCKVCGEYNCQADLETDGPVRWVDQQIKECSKVIVLLSPEVLKLRTDNLEIRQNNCGSEEHYFFLDVLPQFKTFKNKLVFVSLETYGPIWFPHFESFPVYSLPQKLNDLLKVLAPNSTIDEKTMQGYENSVRDAIERDANDVQ